MHDYSLFSAILGLSSEWRISDVTVCDLTGITEVHIRSQVVVEVFCKICGVGVVSNEVRKVRWLHENQHNIRFVVSALLPVMTCGHCGEVMNSAPWEQPGSRVKMPES